jgi:hypothetical protein
MFVSSSQSWSKALFAKLPYSRSRMNAHPIQNIYESLESIESIEAAAANPANCSSIQSCLEQMNLLKLEDFGIKNLDALSESMCMHIFKSEKYHISVFLLPKGSKLPIHDHPSMTVCTKLIAGEIFIRSFTAQSTQGDSIIATMDANETRLPQSDSWLLTPEVGNLHEFEACSHSVIFDILLPPYREPGRPCNFYKLTENAEKQTWLLSKIAPSEVYDTVDLPYTTQYNGIRPVTA